MKHRYSQVTYQCHQSRFWCSSFMESATRPDITILINQANSGVNRTEQKGGSAVRFLQAFYHKTCMKISKGDGLVAV